jgi:hypothetical protein
MIINYGIINLFDAIFDNLYRKIISDIGLPKNKD